MAYSFGVGLHDLSRFSNQKGYRILEVGTEQETTMIERKEVEDPWMEDVLGVRTHLLLKLNRDGANHFIICYCAVMADDETFEKEKTKREGFSCQMFRYF